MRIPCDTNPLRGICSDLKSQQAQIDSLLNQGAVDLSGLALSDHEHDPPDLSDYWTEAETKSALEGYAEVLHGHPAPNWELRFRETITGWSSYSTSIASGTTSEINNFFIYWTALAGSVIEMDYRFVINQTSNSNTNILMFAEVGGGQQPIGQWYEPGATRRIATFGGKEVFINTYGYIQARIIVQSVTGTLVLCDALNRGATMTITEWQQNIS